MIHWAFWFSSTQPAVETVYNYYYKTGMYAKSLAVGERKYL